MNLNLKGDSCDARRRNPRTEASDYRVLPGESMLHSQTLVDQLGHVALLQGHMPWREVEWQRGLRLPRQRTVSGMTRLSKGRIEGAFEVAEVLGEGSAALGCRLHPCAGFCLKEFFGGVDVPGILQLAQVDGEIAAGIGPYSYAISGEMDVGKSGSC